MFYNRVKVRFAALILSLMMLVSVLSPAYAWAADEAGMPVLQLEEAVANDTGTDDEPGAPVEEAEGESNESAAEPDEPGNEEEVAAAVAAEDDAIASYTDAMEKVAAYYAGKMPSSPAGDWEAFVALRAASEHVDLPAWPNYEWRKKDPGFKPNTGDNSHIYYIYGLLSVGQNPADAFDTHRNLFAELASQLNKETGNFGNLGKQIWAMVALEVGRDLGVDVGTWNEESRRLALQFLLSQQKENGSFGSFSQIDYTGWALIVLSRYDGEAVSQSIEKAKQYLKSMQKEGGGFNGASKYESENSNSIACAIQGLVAVGEDLTDRTGFWAFDGKTPMDALLRHQLDDGSFTWQLIKPGSIGMATKQAAVAVLDVVNGQSSWYKLGELTFEPEPDPTPEEALLKIADYYNSHLPAEPSWDWEAFVAVAEARNHAEITPWPNYDWRTKDPGIKPDAADNSHIYYIYGLLGVGQNPAEAFDTKRNLFAELASQQNKETGAFSNLGKQVWAMVALEIGADLGVDVGSWNEENRNKALESLLKQQKDNGSFGSFSQIDYTGWALLVLSRFEGEAIEQSIEKAKQYLKSMQKEGGGFAGTSMWDTENSNSIACAIQGLVAVGEDLTDRAGYWAIDGKTPIDALLKHQLDDGSFTWQLEQTGSIGMATKQSAVAVADVVNGESTWYKLGKLRFEEPELNLVTLPEGDVQPEIAIPNDTSEYKVVVKPSDAGKEITITIPAEKTSKVWAALPNGRLLPKLTVTKGKMTAQFPAGMKMSTGDPSQALELMTFQNTGGATLKEQLNTLVPSGKKLSEVAALFTMGGTSGVTFDQYVTLTFAGMKGKDAAYIADGEIHAIAKFESEELGEQSGKAEYAFDKGNDLIVRTNHFTDFAAYSTSVVASPGDGGTPQLKKATLSIDKLTINKGFVISPVKVEFEQGETVWDVLKRVMDKAGITYKYSWYDQYESVYVASIAGDGEFDHGAESGWMYSVNGVFPNFGASRYILKDGDIVKWRYTTDLGRDVGADTDWETPENPNNPDPGTTPEKPEPGTPSENNGGGAKLDLDKLFSDSKLISEWAYSSITEAVQKDFVKGYDGKINPKSSVTRAEFASMITQVLKLAKAPKPAVSFADVKLGDWYYEAVHAAYQAGIVTGYEGSFHPDKPISREEMAVMIVRALELGESKGQAQPADASDISEWARTAVQAAQASGLMTGSNGKFSPRDKVTREMAIVVAMRAYHYPEQEQPGEESEDTIQKRVSKLIGDTAAHMQKTITNPVVASIGGEWTVFGLARSGVQVPDAYYETYYANLTNTLKAKDGVLHTVKYTEYDRVILALGSIGKDVTKAAGYDLLKPLADFNALTVQGINGPIFALIALDSRAYEIPQVDGVEVQTTRDRLIEFILGREIKGGGWALGEKPAQADPDITAMAIQSLTPYYKTKPEVKAAVDRALQWLSQAQHEDGGFKSWGAVNSESTAQVIVALSALGIDAHLDPRFVKNGRSAIDALIGYAAPGGGFYHIKAGNEGNGGAAPGDVDPMATDQAMYALVAYDRLLQEKNRLYDLTDVK
ncbi:S-layer homology domain-containing protein [Paenibacillus sp. NPDC057967]|uniref:S-layer homology domain-containing protein n=1 Tax=Paenibacillus sp. NPDC057967 TaxID=3346293 RepID=UPI0036DE130F